MNWLKAWLWPSRPPRSQATLDGARLVSDLLDKQRTGQPIKRSEWERARALLGNMPAWEDLYARRPPSYDDWFRGF